MTVKKYDITRNPIDIETVIRQVIHADAGAVNTFIGTVRELTDEKRTLFLEYEAYIPMAEKKLAEIGREIEQEWPNSIVAMTHRIGRLEVSDLAVVIAVSTPHRKAAFEACSYAIDRVKDIVPIWKKEHWDDGKMWIGHQQENVVNQDDKKKGEKN